MPSAFGPRCEPEIMDFFLGLPLWSILLHHLLTAAPTTVALVYGLKEWLLRLRWKNGCPAAAGDSDICRSYASFKRKKVRTTKIIREVEKRRESRVDNKKNHNCAGYLKVFHFHLNLLFLNETATTMFYITKSVPSSTWRSKLSSTPSVRSKVPDVLDAYFNHYFIWLHL